MLAATFDIGTTAVKAVVVRDDGCAVFTGSAGIHTIENENYREQEPDEWYEAFCSLSKEIFKQIPAMEIGALIFSGQMQDVIPVGADGTALRNAILYSDGRAQEQAEKISFAVGLEQAVRISTAGQAERIPAVAGPEQAERISAAAEPEQSEKIFAIGLARAAAGVKRDEVCAAGEARIMEITGNHFDGSMPFAKILWLKEKEPEIYERTAAFLISSKDYVIARLTGSFVGDMTACSTAGAMELSEKKWSAELIRASGLDIGKFPKLLYPHELAGTVTEQAAAHTGYAAGTKAYTGTGDAGATTLASGILSAGEFNINLGTSSWVAAVSDGCMECEGGGFNLAAMQAGKYINVVPFFNGGNVHKFLGNIFSGTARATSQGPDIRTSQEPGIRTSQGPGIRTSQGPGIQTAQGLDTQTVGCAAAAGAAALSPDYEFVSRLLKSGTPGSHGVYFLPYLAGERFPVMDEAIRGCYMGLSQETTAADMAQSALEGVAYSIRQGLELFQTPVKKLTLIGGGAREAAWCRILCNVMGTRLYVYKNPDLLPALAIAASVFLAEGYIKDYEEFIGGLEAQGHCTVLEPDMAAKAQYDKCYVNYKKIYPLVREFYSEGRK